MKRTIPLCLLVVLLTLITIGDVHPAQSQSVVIGVVTDGPYERHPDLVERFRQEATALLSIDFDVRVPEDKVLAGDWTLAGIGGALDRLLLDPDVDAVVALGPLASHVAALRTNLAKPVIAAMILDSQIQGMPRDGDSSGVPNLSYIEATHQGRDLFAFREIIPFDRVAVLVPAGLAAAIPDFEARARAHAAEINVEVQLVPVAGSAGAALDLIGDVEAVYVSPLFQLDQSEFGELVRGLVDRRLPSYSWVGAPEVRDGILMGRTPQTFGLRLTRRAALNLQRILLGEAAASIPVEYPAREGLTINVSTAHAIGFYPNWRVLTEAELFDVDIETAARTLSLESAVNEAIDLNLDLAAKDREVAAGAQDVRLATSALLPQIDVAATRSVIDEDRAEASLGQVSERTTTGSARLTQSLYSDPLWANRSVESSIQESRELDRETLRLDIALDAGVTYLNVLRAKTFERIQRENLRVTRSNLQLAQQRVSIGTASLAEEYRWQNQIANDRQAVVDAAASTKLASIELNRLLHRPLEERFTTEETELDDVTLIADRDRIFGYIDNPWSFAAFRDFMSGEALAASPELAGIESLTRAQDRILVSANRAFWLPTLSLQADVQNRFSTDGAGSDFGIDLGNFDGLEGLPDVDDLDWSVGLSVTYPLFSGGSRIAARSRAVEDLAQLDLELEATSERIEQRLRTALIEASASLINIDFSRQAAEAARKNFELTQDSYGRGVGTILDVLDAQRQALVAEEAAANSVYDFYIDWLRVQRAVGRFEFLQPADARRAFFDRLDTFFREFEDTR